MAKTALIHQENRITFPPDSLLHLRIMEARVDELPRRSGNGTWEKLNVKFQIQQVLAIGGAGPDAVQHFANWHGEHIYGSVPFFLSDKEDNDLRLWLEAIFEIPVGESLPLGFEFDSNQIVGRYCKGVTGQYKSNKLDAQGAQFSRHEVKGLLPAGNLAAPVQQYQQQAPAQWGQPPQQQAQQGWSAPPQQYPPQTTAPTGQQGWGQTTQPQYQQAQAQPQAQPQSQTPQDPWATPGVTQQQAVENIQQAGLWTPPGQQPQGPPQQQAQPVQQYQQPAQAGQQNPQAPPVPAPAVDPWAGTEDWQQTEF